MKAKLAFISAHGSTYSVRLLCAVLGVARSWFHDWQAGDPARTQRTARKPTWLGDPGYLPGQRRDRQELGVSYRTGYSGSDVSPEADQEWGGFCAW